MRKTKQEKREKIDYILYNYQCILEQLNWKELCDLSNIIEKMTKEDLNVKTN